MRIAFPIAIIFRVVAARLQRSVGPELGAFRQTCHHAIHGAPGSVRTLLALSPWEGGVYYAVAVAGGEHVYFL